MKYYDPLDTLSNVILSSLIRKTGTLLMTLEERKDPPPYFEGDKFTWSLDENDAILTIDLPNEYTGDLIKIDWNGKYNDEIQVKSNINISATENLAFYASIEKMIYDEINDLINKNQRTFFINTKESR